MTARSPTLGTWVRTIRGLEASQLLHRARLQARRRVNDVTGCWFVRRRLASAPARSPRCLPIVSREAELHTPEEAEAMTRGEVHLLHQRFSHPGRVDWLDPQVSRLRLYHLHYFDFLWSFVAHPDREWARDRAAGLIRDWESAVHPGAWSPWHPYVVATRGWNLVQAVPTLFHPVPDDLARLIWLHGDQIYRNLEHDVGGNHLVRDLRGLVGLALAFDEPGWLITGIGGLVSCVEEQVLPDGGHFERSAFYHSQVLIDLEEVCDLLAVAGQSARPELEDAVRTMRSYLELICPPGGRLPVFNDGVATNPRLGPITPDPGPGLRPLDDTGYLVGRRGPFHLVFDIGRPSPPTLPAHGQCSLLSCELTLDDRPLLVNCGSSEYDDPLVRARERGTLSHNTVMVDSTEQSEIWATFRMGRQASPTGVEAAESRDAIVLSGSHDGYDRLPGSPRHSRQIRVTTDEVRVVDRITGAGHHRVEGRWLVHPEVGVEPVDERSLLLGGALLSVEGPVRVLAVPPDRDDASWVAQEYGVRVPTTSVRWQATAELPIEVVTTLVLRETR